MEMVYANCYKGSRRVSSGFAGLGGLDCIPAPTAVAEGICSHVWVEVVRFAAFRWVL